MSHRIVPVPTCRSLRILLPRGYRSEVVTEPRPRGSGDAFSLHANFCKLVLAFFAAASLHAAEVEVRFTPSDTRIQYTVDSVLHTVKGTFRFKSGDIRFDTAGGKASGMLIADATTGDSGDHARDIRMHKEIIQSTKYPEITFAPDSIDGPVKLEGDSTVQVHGMFGIHGGLHEMTVPANVHVENGTVNLTTTFNIPYIAWGMKNPSTLFLRVSNTVKIDLQAAGKLSGAQ